MRAIVSVFTCLLMATMLVACDTASDPPVETEDASLSGGAMTVRDASSMAYSFPADGLDASSLEKHTTGDAAFEAKFVTAPAPVHGGLGPLYNNISCDGCHPRDGRGSPALDGARFRSMLFRVSVPGANANGGPKEAQGFGDQIQDRATVGTVSEADVQMTYSEKTVRCGDGETISLRVPQYRLVNAYTSIPAGMMISPRVAPPVFGLGLLEAVEEASIRSRVDEMDRDGDGISGRANEVWDVQANRRILGRFGWKANQPNLRQQTAAAYNGDMGITSSLFPLENSHGQLQAIPAHDVEVDDNTVDAVAHYIRTLAVPARRSITQAQVQDGERVFRELQCGSCHVPAMRTGALANVPQASYQLIRPYTDLLLHDMGEDLADGRPDFKAEGREWRTPPLWGIGLTEVVHGHSYFLHDGRARSLLEAIAWHDGEARKSKDAFLGRPKKDRDALIAFLRSL